jgi:hypothetical protein
MSSAFYLYRLAGNALSCSGINIAYSRRSTFDPNELVKRTIPLYAIHSQSIPKLHKLRQSSLPSLHTPNTHLKSVWPFCDKRTKCILHSHIRRNFASSIFSTVIFRRIWLFQCSRIKLDHEPGSRGCYRHIDMVLSGTRYNYYRRWLWGMFYEFTPSILIDTCTGTALWLQINYLNRDLFLKFRRRWCGCIDVDPLCPGLTWHVINLFVHRLGYHRWSQSYEYFVF